MKVLTKVDEFRFIRLVKDLAKHKKFYEEIFGWDVVEDWERGILYNTGAAIFELIQDEKAGEYNNTARVAIAVPDVHKLYEELKDKVQLVFGIRDNSWGDTSFRILDPDGFPITIFSPHPKN